MDVGFALVPVTLLDQEALDLAWDLEAPLPIWV